MKHESNMEKKKNKAKVIKLNPTQNTASPKMKEVNWIDKTAAELYFESLLGINELIEKGLKKGEKDERPRTK